jgi:hypothetical protein
MKLITWRSEQKLPPEERHHPSWWLHQIFINFAGSMIGCGAAYCLFVSRGQFDGKFDGLLVVFLLIVAIAGIFGFLPWMLFKSSLK